jgi:hypothetical protein
MDTTSTHKIDAFAAAAKVAREAGITQPEGFTIPVTVRVLMWPTAERRNADSETDWRPTPREVAQEIRDRLYGLDLDTGWTIGTVRDE